MCDVCQGEEGRVGLDPTCRGNYDDAGEPTLFGYNCLEQGLKEAYAGLEGVAAIVEPFGDFSAHYYYRLDEMPAYQFVREDVEAMSWLMLTVGDACARCGEQSHVAWLTPRLRRPAAAGEPAGVQEPRRRHRAPLRAPAQRRRWPASIASLACR